MSMYAFDMDCRMKTPNMIMYDKVYVKNSLFEFGSA